jgi:regulator of protease activity HflC (stomatin/prohibitin superfamily)
MEERDRQFIPGLGFLTLAIILLGAIGSLLHDSNEVPFGVGGAILWGGAALISFVLGTAYVSRRLLPLQGNLGWSEGFRLLWRNYTMGAANLLYGRRSAPAIPTSKKKKPKVDELSPSFGLLGAGFLYSHQAAAITRGNSYSRADGPGLVFLHGGETIAKVFDLRPHSRKQTVSAITRDGIPVETSVSVTFQVRRPATDQRRPRSVENDPIPYPYDKDALFDLTYTFSVHDDSRRDWTEQVAPQAATMLITELGKYTLDELLDSAGNEPLNEIKERIKNGLKEQQANTEFQTISKGLDIVGVGIGPLELPPDVTAKRLTTWQVAWQNRISQETVSGDIEAQRLYAQARARAQVENIENLLTSIEAMRTQSGVNLPEVVMLRLTEILETLAAARTLAPVAPRVALANLASEASSELRQAMGQDEG